MAITSKNLPKTQIRNTENLITKPSLEDVMAAKSGSFSAAPIGDPRAMLIHLGNTGEGELKTAIDALSAFIRAMRRLLRSRTVSRVEKALFFARCISKVRELNRLNQDALNEDFERGPVIVGDYEFTPRAGIFYIPSDRAAQAVALAKQKGVPVSHLMTSTPIRLSKNALNALPHKYLRAACNLEIIERCESSQLAAKFVGKGGRS